MKLIWLSILLAVLAFSAPAWADDELADGNWWEKHYQKINKTDDCSDMHMYFNLLRPIF